MNMLIARFHDLQAATTVAPWQNASAARSRTPETPRTGRPGVKAWAVSVLALGAVAGGVVFGPQMLFPKAPAAAAAPPPSVSVSQPLQRAFASRLQFLGQFSAVDSVELRAQVGGTLKEISFKDGDIVHKGDLLFVIDPTPYEIALSEAKAQLATARAQLDLATRQFVRADTLKKTGYGTVETADQRASEQQADQAAVEAAEARIRDAQFDLDHTRITAPFAGRIGSHLVSAGNLVAGSRAASSPTTLLATIVSLDTIYLNFDMSEADYLAFAKDRARQDGPLAGKVKIALSGDAEFDRRGVLDFVDNRLDRASGTIHARATVPNGDHFLMPGAFGRVRFDLGQPKPALLVPDAAVLPDQSTHLVLTVGDNDVVTPKMVEIGGLRGGLRVIRSGLAPTDRVIVDGVPTVRPGAKVNPEPGAIRFAADPTQS